MIFYEKKLVGVNFFDKFTIIIATLKSMKKLNFFASILVMLGLITISHGQNDIHKNNGYFNITRLGIISTFDATLETFDTTNGIVVSDLPDVDNFGFSLQTINGYFINKNISLGIGIGLDRYNNPSANTLPLFLDTRYYFSEDSRSLYVLGNFGGLIKIENGTRRGSMINLGLGYKFPFNEKSRTFFVSDISFSHKSISLDGLPISDSVRFSRVNGIMISFGLIFWFTCRVPWKGANYFFLTTTN